MQSRCKLCSAKGIDSVFDDAEAYNKHIYHTCREYGTVRTEKSKVEGADVVEEETLTAELEAEEAAKLVVSEEKTEPVETVKAEEAASETDKPSL